MRDSDTPLILPGLGPFYDRVAQPLAHLGLRVLVGALLIVEGWPKITAPFAMAGFTESIGMYPGWLWSAVLAVLQFVGGLMILVGFLTRPAALANGVMLAVTYWFHVTHPYGTALLTPEGIAALPGQASLFTADGLRNLGADGGGHLPAHGPVQGRGPLGDLDGGGAAARRLGRGAAVHRTHDPQEGVLRR